jgi:RNA polymerase sigma-70 factor (ECF subfamily)
VTAISQAADGVNDLRAALSDDAAFEAWYRRMAAVVYAYIVSRCGSPDLAEELTQETFLSAIANRNRYEGRSDVAAWLRGIARHKLADHYRSRERADRRRLRLEVREIKMATQSASAPTFDEQIAIVDALEALPPLQRAMLTFVALDGLPVDEAGQLIGKGHAAAQSLLARAREGFRRSYGRNEAR